MARLGHFGPTGDSDGSDRYSSGESNTGLPEDYSHHWRRLSNNFIDLRYDLSLGGAATPVNLATTYRSFWIRVWRLPSVETGFWFLSGTAQAGAALLLTMDSTGVVRLYNKGNAAFPGELFGSLGTVVLQQWHFFTVQGTFETNSLRACSAVGCGSATAQMDSNIAVTGSSHVGATAGVSEGIGRSSNLGFRDGLGRGESTSPLMDIEYANWIPDDSAYPTRASRISALRVAALGTYQQWVNAGLPQWQVRNEWPGTAAVAGSDGIRTATASQKQTYLLESFSAAGITGSILGAILHVYLAEVSVNVPDVIVIRNAVEVVTAAWVPVSAAYLRYRLDTTGWTTSDTLEIGLRNAAAGGALRMGALVLSVEHDTAVPAITIGDVQTDEVSWTGNDTAQDVTLPFADPQMILWWPRSNASSGGLWLAEANTAHTFATPGSSRPTLRVRGTTLSLVGAETTGPNITGVLYDALVVRDPKMRMLAAGTYAQTNNAGDDNYNVTTRDPFGAAFAPLVLLAGHETTSSTSGPRYYGPGVVGDLALTFLGSGSAADWIQSLSATGFQAGTLLNQQQQQVSYAAFRRSAFTSTFLMDAGSYVGDGTASRVIPVNISGLVVKWCFVQPLVAVTHGMRNSQQSGTKQLNGAGGAYSSTGISALGTDSFTVAIAFNAIGATYTWLVFGYGTDKPPAPISIVECLHGSSVALLELAGSHTETFEAVGSYRDTLTLEAGYRATLTSTGSLVSTIAGLTGSI